MASKSRDGGNAAQRLATVTQHLESRNIPNAMATELEASLKQGVKDGKVPQAIVYATNKDGSFQYSYATGYQNYGINEDPIQSDAMLMLASQTKLLTAIASMKVVEQGLIGLDDDVTPHLPELGKHKILTKWDEEKNEPVLVDRKNPITLRTLLTHTSGLTYGYVPEIVRFIAASGRNPADQTAGTIPARFDYPLIYEPGTSWAYSPGLDWAGLLVQRLSGMELEEFEKKHMWAPLGITGITFWPKKNPDFQDKTPTLCVRKSDGTLGQNTKDTLNTHSTDCFGGHGAYARLGDYIKVLQSLLKNDGKLLTPAGVDELFRPQLGKASEDALNDFRLNLGWSLVGEFEKHIPVSYALGGIVFMEDDVGRRKKGTLSWGGLVNPFWIVDREAGLAFTFGVQCLPPGDPGCKEMTGVAERAVYKMAGLA